MADGNANAQTGSQRSLSQDRMLVAALVLLASPFYLNDFANLVVRDWRWWLLIDYAGVKLFPLLVVVWLIRGRHLSWVQLGLVRQSAPAFLAAFLLVTLVGTLMDQNSYKLIEKFPGYRALFPPAPEIASPLWNGIDLTLGLLAVGVFEELVFRGYFYAVLSRHTRSRAAIIVLSSVAFGFIHWSAGAHAVLVTTAIGAVLMAAYMTTRSLPAIMLAHAAIDFVDFAGVIPKAVFKFV